MPSADRAARYALGSGVPCVAHHCVQCCVATEMPLSEVDIERLLDLGHRLEAFAVRVGAEWRLRNRYGSCVFLAAGGCTIYPHRPEGCQIYPLVYNETQQRAVLHRFCPHRHEFAVSRGDVDHLMLQLQRLNLSASSEGRSVGRP
jgi:hypothetical protein